MWIDNKILIAGPIETLKALGKLCVTASFRKTILATIIRIGEGFLIGSTVALILSVISYRITIIEEFISPLVSVIKAVPVVSFIIMILIWSGPSVAVVISALVVSPIIYINTLQGLKSTPKDLLDMSRVYKVPFVRQILYVYLPSVKPFLTSAFSLAIGMAWKSGIAAELIDQTRGSLGNELYRAKINLLTADLLAWTVAAVILSFISEKLILLLIKRIPGSNERRGV